jgi:hypothetical protein
VGEVRLIYEMGRFKDLRLHVKEGDVSFCVSVFLSALSLSTPPFSATCKMQHASSTISLFSSTLHSRYSYCEFSATFKNIFHVKRTDEYRIIYLR